MNLKWNGCRNRPAFSLIEMVAAIAVLLLLMVAGVSLLSGTGSQARKAGTDMLTGMIEQARAAAITSRSYVVLAIAEPGDLPSGDECCSLGLFRVDNWPGTESENVAGVLMSRWRTLESGVVVIGGEVDGVTNPLDAKEITIQYGASEPLSVKVHVIAFNPRGGLHYPPGPGPIAMRIAEGAYRGGKASPNRGGSSGAITENLLKVGRVTARPYRIDG